MMNPVNENLRNDIPKAPDMQEILEDIQQKTNNIHVAFLFTKEGLELLQQLSLNLCATRNSLVYSGWQELGVELGLDPLLPKCINNCNIMNQDPVFTMFVACTQINTTVGKIYQGLYNIERFDVLTRTHDYVNIFYDNMCKRFDISRNDLTKPPSIPKPPLLFQKLGKFDTCDKIIDYQTRKINEIKCKSAPTKKTYKNLCDRIVMLTYCAQDAAIAENIAAEFRKERNGQRIGVILLEDHAEKIHEQREEIILKFFTKADYIMPVVSTEYMSILTNNDTYSAVENMDSVYAKYIYQLMTSEYIADNCKNKKIRSIILDEHFPYVIKHYIFKNPIFRTWFQLSDINELADKILAKKI